MRQISRRRDGGGHRRHADALNFSRDQSLPQIFRRNGTTKGQSLPSPPKVFTKKYHPKYTSRSHSTKLHTLTITSHRTANGNNLTVSMRLGYIKKTIEPHFPDSHRRPNKLYTLSTHSPIFNAYNKIYVRALDRKAYVLVKIIFGTLALSSST